MIGVYSTKKGQLIMKRKGGWIQTWSGKKFWPLDPRKDDIFIRDIAHALGNICRFNGHCSEFYSVAEHSVYVSENVEPRYAMAGLLHDSAEAYTSDIPTPIKPHLKNYSVIENRILSLVYEKYGVDPAGYKNVKQIDLGILADEQGQLMKRIPYHVWTLPATPLGIKINCWSPKEASDRFYRRFLSLSNG